MRYFTTDASGTRAVDFFFTKFFIGSSATSLPAGSFDISTITKVENTFFWTFSASYSSLESLLKALLTLQILEKLVANFFMPIIKTEA